MSFTKKAPEHKLPGAETRQPIIKGEELIGGKGETNYPHPHQASLCENVRKVQVYSIQGSNGIRAWGAPRGEGLADTCGDDKRPCANRMGLAILDAAFLKFLCAMAYRLCTV